MIRRFALAALVVAFSGIVAFALTATQRVVLFRGAAIQFVSDGGYVTSGTSPVSVTAPTGMAVGDLMVWCANLQTTVAQGTLTTPATFTLGGSTGAVLDGGTGFVNTYLFYRTATLADTTTASFSLAYNTGGTLANIASNIRAYRGVKSSSPLNQAKFVATSASSTLNVVPVFTETFSPGEIYVGCSATDINVDVTTTGPTSPQLFDVFNPPPFTVRIYMGDYFPTGVPPAETFTYQGAQAGRTAWGATFKSL